MCLLAAAWRVHAEYPLILAANRDEWHARPAWPAHAWDDAPGLIGGRDRVANGTWMAARLGRVAAITNIYDGAPRDAAAPSRGELPVEFLRDDASAHLHAASRQALALRYAGFNLLLATPDELLLVSNRLQQPIALPDGIHAISNALPGEDWPKTRQARAVLREVLDAGGNQAELVAAAFGLLASRAESNGRTEPIPPHDERLASIFVRGAEYGTRCSTVALLHADGHVALWERQFDADGQFAGEVHLHTRDRNGNAEATP